MLPYDADPVLAEARELRDEMRRVHLAARTSHGEAARAQLKNLEQLRARLDALLEDDKHRALVDHALDERARTLRIVVAARKSELDARARADEATAIVTSAARAARGLTAAERERVRALTDEGDTALEHDSDNGWRGQITSAERRDAVLEALGTLRVREARQQLRHGLLLTGQMRGIIAEALPALTRGEPVLLVGETGGAKTALAEHLAIDGMGLDPELVSGYGDITSAQVIGSHELRAERGATVSVFVAGPLLRAMTEGRPVILDEINAMPAEFLKRLNRILQLRPGDSFGVQEDAGREVRVAQGFAILATANEQTPHRYRGLDRLSAELINRFGANGYRVHYPDTERSYEEVPVENVLLALAAVVDQHGALPDGLTSDEVVRVARAAFISQQVFAGSHGAGFTDYVSTEREIDGRPGLDEAVLAPRTLVAVLQKVAGSAGAISLDRALTRFVESVMHREDRRVLALILEGQGFRLG